MAGDDWTREIAPPMASWMNEACMARGKERRGRGLRSRVVGFGKEEEGLRWEEEEEEKEEEKVNEKEDTGKVWRVEKAINLYWEGWREWELKNENERGLLHVDDSMGWLCWEVSSVHTTKNHGGKCH